MYKMEKYINNQRVTNKMKFKYFAFIFLFLFSFVLVSAQQEDLGFVKQGDCMTWKQVYSNATYTNFSDIKLPNGTTNIFSPEIAGTKSGITYYHTNCTYTSLVGEYQLCGHTDVDGVDTNWCYSYDVTYTGEQVTGSLATFYIVGIIVLVLLFFVVLGLINKLPSEDAQDQAGNIIQINQLKHLRSVLWIVEWLIVLAGIFIVSNMMIAYLPYNMLGNFFFTIYKIMFWVMIIAVPVRFIWLLVSIFHDKEVKRMIERGIEVPGSSSF